MSKPRRLAGCTILQIHAVINVPCNLDLSVIPANARDHASRHESKWSIPDGPYGKAAFHVHFGNSEITITAATRARRNIYDEFCAYVRAALRLWSSVVFCQEWAAFSPCRSRPASEWFVDCTFLHGVHGRITIGPDMCAIRASRFSDLEHLAAAVMHRKPFAPVGARFFGFDRDALIDLAPYASRDTEFRWSREKDRGAPKEDGWPPIDGR